MPTLRCIRRSCLQAAVVLLAACSNGRGSLEEPALPAPPTQPAQDTFSVGGTVAGLAGSGLVLQSNGGDDLTIAGNGSFVFASRLAGGVAYNVTVRSQPGGQSCVVRNASGTIAAASVTNVEVSCASGQLSNFSVGGTVSGLSGSGLVLQLGGESLSIASNGSFTFGTSLASGTRYSVIVATQPSNPIQTCTVASAEGTIGSANVTNVRVTCAAGTFSIGGAVSGLLGSGLVLRNNGGNDIAVNANGSFTFSTELATGATYNVTVRTQPANPTQACTVSNGRGTVDSNDITSVAVSCNTSDFTIGGTVSGLTGSAVVLRNNGTDELTVDSNGGFTFDTGLPSGASYNVAIAEQPNSQTCTISNGSGVVGLANVATVTVRCSPNGFRVSGHVHGLRGSGLVLQNNGSDDLAIASNGRFTFPSLVPSGAPYNVTVAEQPDDPDQTCEVDHGAGTIGGSDVDGIEIRCRRDRGDDDDD